MAWNDWGPVDAKQLFDPGNFIWDHASNAPTQYDNNDQFNQFLNNGFQNMASAPAAQLQMGNDPFRQAQLQQMQQLQGVASGQQQGAGELAAQRQIQNALAAQQAQARMARGGNAAMAYRNAANQSAALGSTGAGMGQQAALQDQMAAHGQLAGIGAQGRQGDIGVANANAGYQQAQGQQNAGNYLQLLNQLNQRQQNKYNADLGIGAQQDSAAAAKSGGLLQGIGAVLASDERLKTDITDSRADIDALLDGLKPVGWTYKDAKHGEGRWDGIIAQDMERSEAGKRIVRDTADGKMLDVNKALSATLAAAARLNERVRDLEGKAK